ncbi:MAG: HEAT repeat domain-containing protein [Polyangiaceae bacterium]
MNRQLVGVVSVAACLLASLGAVACRQDDHAADSKISPKAIAEPVWTGGTGLRYSVLLNSEAQLQQGSMLSVRLTGQLTVVPTAVDTKKLSLVLLLSDVHVEGRGPDGEQSIEALARELTQPAFFEFEAGRMREAWLPRGVSAFAASIERTLGAALQFVVPPDARGDKWTSLENDGTGQYRAEYQALPPAGKFGKRKLSYQSLIASNQNLPRVSLGSAPIEVSAEVVRSDGSIELDAARHLAAVSYKEELRAKLMQATPVTSTTTLELKLSTVEAQSAAPKLSELSDKLVHLAADQPYLAAAPVNLDPAHIAGMTFEQALSELETLEKDWKIPAQASSDPKRAAPDPHADQERAQRLSHVFIALEAIFRQKPETIAQAVASIRAGSPAKNALVDALAASGSAGGQAAVLTLVGDKQLAAELRQAAAGGLIRVDHPTDATVAGLARLIDDPLLEDYATYGLGTFARKLRSSGEVERSDRISRVLLEKLGHAKTRDEKITALRGLANSAYPGALPAVQPYLKDSDSILRASGVEALRLMQHPAADALVAAALSDASINVRNAALETAAVRHPDSALLAAVPRIATTATDAYGRLEAVHLLARWLEEHGELRAVLEQTALKDPEPKVREAARQAVGG